MQVVQDIAEILSISLDEAKEVRDYIDDWCGIDYSEITRRAFVREVKEAYAEMRAL